MIPSASSTGAAREILTEGSFAGLAQATPYAQVNALMAARTPVT